jgi:hypothetical protein
MKVHLAGLFLTLALFSAPLSAQILGANLLVNGTAEAGAASPGSGQDVVPIPGWTNDGGATVVYYDSDISDGGFPLLTDPGPPQRGLQLFTGGYNTDTTTLSQTIDVTALAGRVDTGTIHAALSAYLGGFSDQEDNATVEATFVSGFGATLGTSVIGPVTATDRGSASGLLARSQDVAVPAQTRSIVVSMIFERATGTYNDGYADNISLVLTDTATPAATGVRIYPAYVATPIGSSGLFQLNPAVEVTWPSESGKTYQVERSDDLITWADFGAALPGSGSTLAVFDRTDSAPKRFYRIKNP